MSGFGRWEMIMERVTGKVHGYADRLGICFVKVS